MSWSAVGYRDHPIPTNVAVASAELERLGAVAAHIKAQAERLRSVGDTSETWKSDAADKFRTAVQDLPPQLEALAQRYEKVSGALREFVATTVGAKAAVEQARVDGERAVHDRGIAENGLRAKAAFEEQARREAHAKSAANPGAPPVPPMPYTGPDHAAARAAADRARQAEEDRARGAVARFNGAAEHACGVIDAAINDGVANDRSPFGWLKKVGNWLDEHLPLEAINSIASAIAGVATLLAIIVPGPWSPILLGIAFAAGVLAVLCTAAKIFSTYHRGGLPSGWDWASLGLDVIALVPIVGAGGKVMQGSLRVSGRASRFATFLARSERAIDLVDTGETLGSGARNTGEDLLVKKKGIVESVIAPGGLLWAGVGLAAGGGRFGDEVSGALFDADGDVGRGAMAYGERDDAAELAARARADAETFTPKPVPVPPVTLPAPEPPSIPFLRPDGATMVGPNATGAHVARVPMALLGTR